jgi:hypothetical protein
MRMLKLIMVGLIVVMAWGADEKNQPLPPRPSVAVKPVRRDATPNLPSLSAFDVYKNISLLPGQGLGFQALTDFTGADKVAIAIKCPPTTNLKNVAIVVSWGMPIADWLSTTDVILGSNFLFPNSGGAVVPAYGNILHVEVNNMGTTPVTCD